MIADDVLKVGVFGKATLTHWIVIIPLAIIVAAALG